MTERLLFVDDEPKVLEGLQRQLRGTFQVTTAIGPNNGLETIVNEGPFAVVISDMRMPGMNGIELLEKVREFNSDTVRMMLTGYADLKTAIDAVNQGHIFRLLTKPCPKETLIDSLQAGVDQYRLITSERELLTKTLTGSVKAMIDILALTNPKAFGRSAQIRSLVRELAEEMGVSNLWEMEIAALLSKIGFVSVPDDILNRICRNEHLTNEELRPIHEHPQVGHNLLANIPRLAGVAKIVKYQNKRYDGIGFPNDNFAGIDIPLGARILKVANDFETLTNNGTDELALQELRSRVGFYDTDVVAALAQVVEKDVEYEIKALPIEKIPLHSVIAKDVFTNQGELIIQSGSEVSPTILMKLRGAADAKRLEKNITVRIRSESDTVANAEFLENEQSTVDCYA